MRGGVTYHMGERESVVVACSSRGERVYLAGSAPKSSRDGGRVRFAPGRMNDACGLGEDFVKRGMTDVVWGKIGKTSTNPFNYPRW